MKRMTTVIAEELPEYDANKLVVLSGPSHAEEVIFNVQQRLLLHQVMLQRQKRHKIYSLMATFVSIQIRM